MKPTLSILLLASACLALGQPKIDRFVNNTTNAVAFIASKNAYYELVPSNVPLPGGSTQQVVTMRRMTTSQTTYTNRPIVLTLRCAPPFQIEVSTNLVSWDIYDQSTNAVANLEICAEQQVAFPNAFFRCRPIPAITRILRGF